MREVQKKNRALLATVKVAGVVIVLGTRASWLRYTGTPSGHTLPVLAAGSASLTSLPRTAAEKAEKPAVLSCACKPGELIVPVAGVQPHQLHDTFQERRPDGRRHQALD